MNEEFRDLDLKHTHSGRQKIERPYDPPAVKPQVIEKKPKRFRAQRKKPPKANLDSFEGVVETIKEMVSGDGTPTRERLAALKTLCDVRGFKQPKDYSDLRRLSNIELLDAIQTIILPALYSFGIRDKYDEKRGGVAESSD